MASSSSLPNNEQEKTESRGNKSALYVLPIHK